MWPWGHAGFGYLLARAVGPTEHVRGVHLVALLLGTQFPDLIDKPLAWSFAVLPSGRSLAHSLFTLAIVVGAAWLVCRRYERASLAGVFGIGYASHLLGDALNAIVSLEWQYLTFLVWPLQPLPPYQRDSSFVAHFQSFQFTTWTWLGFLLFASALVLGVRTELNRRY